MTMRTATAVFTACVLGACSGATPGNHGTAKVDLSACSTSCPGGRMFLTSELTFAMPNSAGRVEGFNLDGRVSDEHDGGGCNVADFVAPDGTPGIDSQTAHLMPTVIATLGEAFPTLVHNALLDGGLSLLVEFAGLDAGRRGGPVGVVFRRGAGAPMVGTDGKILPDQTFGAYSPWLGSTADARFTGDKLRGGPLDLQLYVRVFGIGYQLEMKEVRFTFEFLPDGTVRGVLGGGVPIAAIESGVVARIDVREVANIVHNVVPPLADLILPGGTSCDAISGTVVVKGIHAFTFASPATGADAGRAY